MNFWLIVLLMYIAYVLIANSDDSMIFVPSWIRLYLALQFRALVCMLQFRTDEAIQYK
jgi:predicted tellurium resistance membrane protein TerC